MRSQVRPDQREPWDGDDVCYDVWLVARPGTRARPTPGGAFLSGASVTPPSPQGPSLSLVKTVIHRVLSLILSLLSIVFPTPLVAHGVDMMPNNSDFLYLSVLFSPVVGLVL